MDFILYNKHQPLCAFTLNADGTIKKITEVYNEAYAPLGVNLHDRLSLYEWWKGRSIPGSRDGLSKFLSSFKISSSTLLQDGFSLEQCKKILLNSPNLKNHRMVDLFMKNCC